MIVLIGAVGAVSAATIASGQAKRYSATAALLFSNPGYTQQLVGQAPDNSIVDPTRVADTNLTLLSLPGIQERTAKALGVPQAQVANAVTVGAAGNSNVAQVTATESSPQSAARVANKFANQFIQFRRSADRAVIAQAQSLIASQLAGLSGAQRSSAEGRTLTDRAEQLKILSSVQPGNAQLVQKAELPTSPSSPKPLRDGIFGGIGGLVLGCGLAFLASLFDGRLRDSEEIQAAFGLPVISVLPKIRELDTNKGQGAAAGIEQVRMLRANLSFSTEGRDLHVVVVTSAGPGDGKTTVAWNLAVATTLAGKRALLIEGDLRRPKLAQRWSGGPAPRGLSDYLLETVEIEESISRISLRDPDEGPETTCVMDVIAAGGSPRQADSLFDSPRMHELIEFGREHYEWVIVDTPPAGITADAMPVMRWADGVVVVVRERRTSRALAEVLRQRLASVGAPVVGIVINAARETGGRYGRHRLGHGYEYGLAKRGSTSRMVAERQHGVGGRVQASERIQG